jgi:hypothetical protein
MDGLGWRYGISPITVGSSKGVEFGGFYMAEEESGNDAGKTLVYLGLACFWAMSVLDFEGSVYLALPGVLLIAIGAFLIAQQKGQRFSEAFAQQVNPLLPTSKGVEFLETVTGWADNPDTDILPVGAQPEGTHPTMGGVSESQFSASLVSGEFTRTPTAKGFLRNNPGQEYRPDPYNEFATHEHERIMPREWTDPVGSWYNVHEEWQNPTEYW